MAIADAPVPPDLIQETTAAAKAKAKPASKPCKTKRYSKLEIYVLNIISTPPRANLCAETTTNTTTRKRWKRP